MFPYHVRHNQTKFDVDLWFKNYLLSLLLIAELID